jgi:hypothetical protein
LGWQDNLADFEDEVLKDIINPSKNYETVRYIHKPYIVTGNTYPPNFTQTDIWFQFYFATSGDTPNYVLDYNPVGISTQENQLMTKQSTESFFRLEFFKTPQKLWNDYTTFNFNDYVNYNNKKYKCVSVSGSTNNTPPISGTTLWWTFISENELACEPPTRQNRRLINSKNLALPLGEKYFHTGSNYGYNIFVPVFTGSNYRNKENMYLFWFDNESVLTDTNLSGTTTLDQYVFGTGTTIQTILFTNENNEITQVNVPTTGTTLIGWTGQTFTIPNQVTYNRNFYHGMNTFFMTAKFFNADRGEILDFINSGQTTSYNITEEKDMYYQIDFDNFDRTYEIFRYTGTTKLGRIGTGNTVNNSITFYEKGGATVPATPTPLPVTTSTPTPTPRPTSTPFATSIPTITPTPEPTLLGSLVYYRLERCNSDIIALSIGYPYFDFYDGQLVLGDDGYTYTINGNTYSDTNPGTNNVVITASGGSICPTPTPTPIATATPTVTPIPATPTPTPTIDPSASTPTPTASPVPGVVTATPTSTPLPPTVTPLPYTITGTYNTQGTVNGTANGTLTVNSGTVTVTFEVFSGVCSGCSNTGYLTEGASLTITSTNIQFPKIESQSFSKGVGVHDFTITSSPDSDNQKYARLIFS